MLAKPIASDNHQSARPPRLILIDAPLSSRLSRYSYAVAQKQAMTIRSEFTSTFAVQLIDEIAAADLLGVSAMKLQKMRKIGEGPRYFICGTAVMYAQSDLWHYMASQGRVG